MNNPLNIPDTLTQIKERLPLQDDFILNKAVEDAVKDIIQQEFKKQYKTYLRKEYIVLKDDLQTSQKFTNININQLFTNPERLNQFENALSIFRYVRITEYDYQTQATTDILTFNNTVKVSDFGISALLDLLIWSEKGGLFAVTRKEANDLTYLPENEKLRSCYMREMDGTYKIKNMVLTIFKNGKVKIKGLSETQKHNIRMLNRLVEELKHKQNILM